MKMSEGGTHWVFMLDGDNTLWDTNAVFTKAQFAALRETKSDQSFKLRDGFEILRQLDDKLVTHYRRHEYDFRALFLALLLFLDGHTINRSLREATRMVRSGVPSQLETKVERCNKAFRRELRKVPPLSHGAKRTLRTLKSMHSVVFLFSEGNLTRVSRMVRTLSLERYFDRIFVGKKTCNLYKGAKKRALGKLMSRRSCTKVVVVGDLLDPDIRIGNRIGAITVLRLGGYKPNQNPRDKMEKPDYVISEIPELLRIVAREERLRTC